MDNLIKSFCVPKIEYECFEIEKNEKRIMVINISQNYDKPYYFNDKCYVLNTQNSKITIMEKEIIDGTPRVLKHNSQNQDSKQNKHKSHIATPSKEEKKIEFEPKIKTEAEELEDLTKELENLNSDFPQADTDLPFFTKDESKEKCNEVEKTENYSQPAQETQKMFERKGNSLTERQEKALVYLTKNSFIKNKNYRELYNVSHKTAHLELIDLVQKKLIKSQGSGRSTCYVINMPVQQQII